MLTDNKDVWRFTWGPNFSSSQAYKQLVGHQQVHNVYEWLWSCLCQPKYKVFFWLLIKDTLSTRNILKRKNMHLESYNCVLCLLNTEETCQHLFLLCPFAKQCWRIINIDIPINEDFPDITDYFKDRLQSQFFLAAVILVCWAIWSARNSLIFEGIQPTIGNARLLLQKEMLLLLHRVRTSLKVQLEQWIQGLL